MTYHSYRPAELRLSTTVAGSAVLWTRAAGGVDLEAAVSVALDGPAGRRWVQQGSDVAGRDMTGGGLAADDVEQGLLKNREV